MTLDLSVPRRTAARAALFPMLDGWKQLLPGLVTVIAIGNLVVAGIVIAGVLGVSAGVSVLAWRRRTWSFDGAVLAVDEGVLTKKQRRIPLERIQQVEVERKLRHLVTGLVVARVETAGGSKSEFDIDGLTVAEAESLRSVVLGGVSHSVPTDTPLDELPAPVLERRLVTLTPGRLMLAGVTGPEILAFPVALVALTQIVGDSGAESLVDNAGRIPIAVSVSLGIIVLVLSGALTSLFTKWDLRVDAVGSDLRMRYGLVRQTEVTFPVSRVLLVTVAQTPARRLMRRYDLVAQTAGRSTSGDRSKLAVPLLTSSEADQLRSELLGPTPLPALVSAPRRGRRRAVIRVWIGMSPLTAAVVVVGLAVDRVPILAMVAAVVALHLVAAPFGLAAHRALGFGVDDRLAVNRQGVLFRSWVHLAHIRVQSVGRTASPFQRRLGLASLRLAHARGSVVVRDRDPADEILGLLEMTAAPT